MPFGLQSNSFSSGHGTEANGHISTAMGMATVAGGDVSTSMGVGTYAASYGEVAIGMYNEAPAAASTHGIASADAVLRVGTGSSAKARRDSLRVMKSGAVVVLAADGTTFDVATELAKISAGAAPSTPKADRVAALEAEVAQLKEIVAKLVQLAGVTDNGAGRSSEVELSNA
ncbi:hypothetical protein EMIHUDRAFT_447846 [Emiliania huxleyi CCMP1516]|uniref:Trimeric autotransporter adhesin YadA-like head domain-containing protein n=2 Tax=Emiliania huxleyi TaxID=2903 RepID=A0A0D3II10_EMIH1|nr:hypothetical protein EMIHUDRAFT_452559 [Emiliania huxleyi CCMP1516]XP_005775580.1 hypothetical protein EMIHUDRAFT_447846 [Emiliania huxleyi CCMP1516]EOD10895.1 hypothetical protein EMIHUDRAFT_452559 [Emiliania huxleyi CCMP1516]EOD23151.1 hypothetical protein EMIHUDRAFT_447846 [Emiliania huxleyi CCMP1516]|eukprot:XP_005763324.1 hypothetical protein EMIHUDRAFT_452559 [Emiliania huxleyi CCMP1516]